MARIYDIDKPKQLKILLRSSEYRLITTAAANIGGIIPTIYRGLGFDRPEIYGNPGNPTKTKKILNFKNILLKKDIDLHQKEILKCSQT
jgi:hypothetical protein